MKRIKEPLLKFRLREILVMTDIYTLSMLFFYTLLILVFFHSINNADNLILLNFLLGMAVLSIATVSGKMNEGSLFRIFRKLYFVPIVFLIYSQVQVYLRVINPYLYDNLLIGWDKAIFGVNPTQWMLKISFPPLTEYLQLCYVMFYFMPIMQGVELNYKKRDYDYLEFSRVIIFGFYLSYILYFFLPAIGPRFTLHDFSSMNTELPGVWLTSFFRDSINFGGGIPRGAANPTLFVNRDCMPSGHTMMTLLNIAMAFRFKSKFRWVFLVIGLGLIFSTVYLRYHYVVDVLAGIFFAYITLKAEPMVRNIIRKAGFTQV
jgi:membrane-associated phospholipid phosphatase